MEQAEHGDASRLPYRVERLLANISRHDWDKVYVVLGDSPEVRQMVNLTLRVRTILRRAPQAMIRGRLTSEEFVEGIGWISRDLASLRRFCEDFAVRAGILENHPEIRCTRYDTTDEREENEDGPQEAA